MKNFNKKVALAFLLIVSYASLLSRAIEEVSVPNISPARPMPAAPKPAVPRPTPVAPIAPQLMARQPRLSQEPIKFTQTEAYFQVPALRDLVTKTFTRNFEPVKHMDIVSRILAKEAELRNTHWAFYHGVNNTWTVWQDTYTALLSHFNPSMNIEDTDFIFLRTRGKTKQTAKDFLVGTLQKYGLVDDNGELKAILLSTNLTLFSNTRLSNESTWIYMMTEKSHEEPDRALYESIMDEFGLPYTYVNEIMGLVKLLETKQQTLLQIFVPKNLVDDISYLAWTRGVPAHGPSIEWVKKSGIKGKEGHSSAVTALGVLQGKFKKEKEKNPLFREILKTAEEGGFSVDAYLKRLCNDPKGLTHIDDVQARLIFTDDILLDPASGVKMFRYPGAEYKKWKEYRKRLDVLIKKMIATKK